MISLLAVVLASEFASAAEPFKIVSAKWLPSGKQNETIAFGDDIDFSVSVPYNLRMAGCYLMKARLSVTLYDKDSRQVVYSFLNEKLLTREEINKGFFANYHIDQDVYDNIGQYYVEVYKTEAWMLCWYGVSDVRELLTYRLYLTVMPELVPITITSNPVTSVNEKSNYNYQVTSDGPKNGGFLFYELSESPSWLSIDSKSGLITGTTPEVSADTAFDVKIKVSERKCAGGFDTTDCNNFYETLTLANQAYSLTVKNKCTPQPIDYYSCQQDTDCVKAQAGCCSCSYGGKNTAINKLYIANWMNWINSQCNVACPASISNDWTCKSNSEAKCVLGKCEIVRIDPNPICGDGICDQGEECILDCGITPEPVCGDGICEQGENCPADCEEPEPVCGDGICEQGENCPADCVNPRPVCGDGTCEVGENCDPDCRHKDDDDEENNYLYKDIYETKYLQEYSGRRPAKTITLVEPETIRAKKGFWALLWESIVEFFGNLF